MRDKHKLTEDLIKLLPEAEQTTVDNVIPSWWYNLRKNGGLRLTKPGYDAFTKKLDLEHYTYNIDDPSMFNKQIMLKLDRKMQMPYYIHAVKGIPKQIIFFGSREAVMVNLYGNLQKFLDNYMI